MKFTVNLSSEVFEMLEEDYRHMVDDGRKRCDHFIPMSFEEFVSRVIDEEFFRIIDAREDARLLIERKGDKLEVDFD
ncbi:MAG: hypothetical protein KIS29_10475 [Thermoplasmata archaeon]|nr:hypothetical protein [Candidatus Sysuiplasma jiujiangense]